MAVLGAWDGRTTAQLRVVADRLTTSDYDTVLTACRSSDETVARAASWMLKAAYEADHAIAYPSDLLAANLHWEIALHLLQSVQHVAVDLSPALIAPYLSHEKPLVRAWALDAYVRTGAPDVEAMLANAAKDTAASVRARARNLARLSKAPGAAI